MQLVDLIELRATSDLGTPSKVERTYALVEGQRTLVAAVVRGVKILGKLSPNSVKGSKRTRYADRALAQAQPLYEGLQMYVDHPDRATPNAPRSYRDRFGRLKAVQAREAGLFGDHHVNPKHPLTEQYLWDAEHNPGAVGLSHNARGSGSLQGDEYVVESIPEVRSVDVVTEPATTASLFESRETPMLVTEKQPEQKAPEGEKKPDVVVVTDGKKPEVVAQPVLEQRVALLEAALQAKDAELALRDKKARIDALLVESRLPSHANTPLLRQLLEGAADEKAEKALLEEYRRLAYHQTPGNPPAGTAGAGGLIETSEQFLEAIDATKQRKGR